MEVENIGDWIFSGGTFLVEHLFSEGLKIELCSSAKREVINHLGWVWEKLEKLPWDAYVF